jgi:transposase InsO family protein
MVPPEGIVPHTLGFESQPTSKALEACIVITKDGRKRRNGWALPSTASVVRKGNCWDNAVAESFFSS